MKWKSRGKRKEIQKERKDRNNGENNDDDIYMYVWVCGCDGRAFPVGRRPEPPKGFGTPCSHGLRDAVLSLPKGSGRRPEPSQRVRDAVLSPPRGFGTPS